MFIELFDAAENKTELQSVRNMPPRPLDTDIPPFE